MNRAVVIIIKFPANRGQDKIGRWERKMQGYAEEEIGVGFNCECCFEWISWEEVKKVEKVELCPHCGAVLRFQKTIVEEDVLILRLTPPQLQLNL